VLAQGVGQALVGGGLELLLVGQATQQPLGEAGERGYPVVNVFNVVDDDLV
jgi:hypothetical protein